MAKILRAVQKIFAGNAPAADGGIAQFGSLGAGSPAFTLDPATIQALSQYLDGWSAAVLGENSPSIEDMNALGFLFARQLAYLFQAGIAEWDATTTYYIGSYVNVGGQIYRSLTDDNLNNAVTDPVNWAFGVAGKNQIIVYGATSHGAVNTKIRVFDNVESDEGAAITRASTANDGDSYTINEDGIYSIRYQDLVGTNGIIGLSVNSAQLTTNIQSITEANRLDLEQNSTSQYASCGITRHFSIGDVIRPHDDGASQGSAISKFTITRVA